MSWSSSKCADNPAGSPFGARHCQGPCLRFKVQGKECDRLRGCGSLADLDFWAAEGGVGDHWTRGSLECKNNAESFGVGSTFFGLSFFWVLGGRQSRTFEPPEKRSALFRGFPLSPVRELPLREVRGGSLPWAQCDLLAPKGKRAPSAQAGPRLRRD